MELTQEQIDRLEINEQLQKHIKKNNWFIISSSFKLEEEFMREFQDYLEWDYISEFQPLFEDFIREFQDKVYFYNIFKYQNISKEFKKEFKDKAKETVIEQWFREKTKKDKRVIK